jgi:hypothetical protein
MKERNLRREALAVALLHSRAEGEGSRLNSPNEFYKRSSKAPMASPLTGTVLTSSLRFVGAHVNCAFTSSLRVVGAHAIQGFSCCIWI